MILEQDIYSKLVEQFGIGEICIKKWRTRKEITWLEFIKTALKLEAVDLYSFCSFSGSNNFNAYFRREFSNLMRIKNGRCWHSFLLAIVNKKRCSTCRELKDYCEFNLDNRATDKVKVLCKECEYKNHQTNTEKNRIRSKNYREFNKEHINKYYQDNKDKISAKQKLYYKINKESIAIKQKDYYLNHKIDYTYREAKRRAAKLQATPNWANQVAIREIYQTCPEGYHVDHIIPLQNDIVCGLHCEFNLQHLSAYDNLSKGNKYEP